MTEPSLGGHSLTGSTSSSLIRRVKEHDQDAWQRLVRLYGPLVDFWIRRAGMQSADIHDIFQEVFTSVVRGIGSFRKEQPGDTFRGWLRTVTRNKVIDHYRRQNNETAGVGGSDFQLHLEAIPFPEAHSEDEVSAIQQLRLRALELIQAEFEPRTWQMFWRVTVGDEPTRDVATALEVSQSAVRLAKSRVLRRLREELGDELP
jgi:RNA polymerase sigma-70 factor (ECF subfamily)